MFTYLSRIYLWLMRHTDRFSLFFFFNDTATTEIYTLSLHDALPILPYVPASCSRYLPANQDKGSCDGFALFVVVFRSEEHTSELQSRQYLVCRLLLEKKKTKINVLGMYTTLIHVPSFLSFPVYTH